uniref:Uncharacterized protein n=1 Tax=Ananas comosus var. bracteatus TaxID=296719 RepID=A0A6V7PLC2_ANACO|nr:unnamed protein product [Ananas comosus var. bracteatus]
MYNGILSKHRVPNYVELLRRVKVVFDTGYGRFICCWLLLFIGGGFLMHHPGSFDKPYLLVWHIDCYEAGKKLVLSSVEDDFKAEMLLTLSKFASKSTILIDEQAIPFSNFFLGDIITSMSKVFGALSST